MIQRENPAVHGAEDVITATHVGRTLDDEAQGQRRTVELSWTPAADAAPHQSAKPVTPQSDDHSQIK